MRSFLGSGVLALSLSLAACQPKVSVGELGDEGQGGAGESTPGGVAGGGVGAQGSSSGAAGGGSAGSSPAECASDLKQYLPNPVADCPVDLPEEFSPCTVPANAICTWQMLDEDPSQGGYYAMGCYESKGAMIWSSRAAVSGGGGGINNEQCPRQAVEANASCADHVGQLCWYPEGQCLCDADSTTWVCDTTATQYLPRPPRQIKRLCVDFDESKLVKDLTEQEARDWCKWSVTYNNNNTPNLELLAPTPPPYDSRNYGVTFGDLGGEVCRPVLPIDACAANLKVAPDCDATLGELSECAETISAQNTRVGRGCEALLQNASCAGVFALRVPNGAACPLPFP